MKGKNQSTSAGLDASGADDLDAGWDLDSSPEAEREPPRANASKASSASPDTSASDATASDTPASARSNASFTPSSIPPSTDALDTDWAAAKPAIGLAAMRARTQAQPTPAPTATEPADKLTAPPPPSARAPKLAATPAALRTATPAPRSVRPIPSLTHAHPPTPVAVEVVETVDSPSSPTAPTAPDTPMAIAAAAVSESHEASPPTSIPAPPFSLETPVSSRLPLSSAHESETLRPSQLEVPPSASASHRSSWPKWAAAAAVVLLAGAGATRFAALREASRSAKHDERAVKAAKPDVAPPLLPAPLAVPSEAPAVVPAASAAEVASGAKETNSPPAANSAPTPALEAAFAAALSAAPGMVQVTVSVTPKGAIVFDHGKRIGTDLVHVNVEPGHSKNLVALLDGYQPRRFSVSSNEPVVNINLKPATGGADESGVAPTPGAVAAPKPNKTKGFDPSADVGSL